MDDAMLERYRGFEVEVVYRGDQSSYRDKGHLRDYGDGWFELLKVNQELFLIPTTAVRLIKVLAPPPERQNSLLRPFEGEVEDEVGARGEGK